MCFFLYVATPLTLTEARAMLPPALRADALAPAQLPLLRAHLPGSQSAFRILHGACSCDLYLTRDPVAHTDETAVRARCQALSLGRDQIIAMLDRHRRARGLKPEPAAHWQRAVADFVAEHARNAGPTLYYRHFSPDELSARPPHGAVTTVSADVVQRDPGGWLPEDRLVVVTPMRQRPR